MHAGTTYFTYRIKVVDAGVSPFINQYAATAVVRCRNHWYRLARDVDANFQALTIDKGEAIADGVCRQTRGNVEQHKGIPMGLHLMVNGAGHNVARSEILPLRRILGAEWLSAGGQQQS